MKNRTLSLAGALSLALFSAAALAIGEHAGGHGQDEGAIGSLAGRANGPLIMAMSAGVVAGGQSRC